VATPPPQILGLTDWRALARGGFATVWQARQESLDRMVAVKVDQRPLDSETQQRRFLREAGAAGRLSGHPGIVTVHDAGLLRDDRPYLVMELCPGGSLSKWLKAEPRLDQRRIRDIGVRIADALAAAHARGVLHRDVKPANILIDAYDHPGLADFGLAALPDPGMELSLQLEAVTPAYAAPEVFAQKPPTEYGDVYSLAATLYALLSGRPPRGTDGHTPTIAEAISRLGEPVPPIPDVDPALMDLLTTALADEPTDRPSAAQFRDRLAALDLSPASGENPAVPLSSPPVTADPPSESGRRTVFFVALSAVVIAALITAVIVTGVNGGGRGGVALPPPSTAISPSGSSPSPSPTPTASPAIPPDFVDCSSPLGEGSLCRTEPECWAGILALGNIPNVPTPASCKQTHVYQTFAAGRLSFTVRRQSQLDRDKNARALCRSPVVNKMLPPRDRRSRWEILVLPPQADKEDFFRCIFGHGNHTGAYKLRPPT
jgi:serine/threonine protein kinase